MNLRLPKKRVLVFGVTGMLGSTIFRKLSTDSSLETFGTIRGVNELGLLPLDVRESVIMNTDVHKEADILSALEVARPDIVINCVGVIKQLPSANDHLHALALNSSLPHRLARYSAAVGARFLHFSTDCVFSGERGCYLETDRPDACDLYGRSKCLGEVEYANSITLRTSIIGHELNSRNSLLEWFLWQSKEVAGFTKAIFSGLPTVEVARVVRDYVLPNDGLRGLFHLSADPISKYDLLCLIAEVYDKEILITPEDHVVIDRSLNSDKFKSVTGYRNKGWIDLIKEMNDDYVELSKQRFDSDKRAGVTNL